MSTNGNVLYLPGFAVVRSARGFLARMDWPLKRGAHARVSFYPGWCHMQPWMLCALAAWGLAAQRHDMTISTTNEASAKYAWRFGLHNFLVLEEVPHVEEHEEAGRFIPLRQVKGTNDLQELIANIVPLLHLAGAPQQAKAIQYAVSEMVRNVLEHSSSPDGAVVSAQFYAGQRVKRHYVSIGVADCGMGVRGSLSRNYNLESDADAVLTSIQPGTTGAVHGMYGYPDNAGAGLFYTRSLSEMTGSYFALGSGTTMFRTSLARQQRLDHDLIFPINRYPGTVVCVEVGLDVPIDFADFLSETSDSFTKAAEQTGRRARELVRFG